MHIKRHIFGKQFDTLRHFSPQECIYARFSVTHCLKFQLRHTVTLNRKADISRRIRCLYMKCIILVTGQVTYQVASCQLASFCNGRGRRLDSPMKRPNKITVHSINRTSVAQPVLHLQTAISYNSIYLPGKIKVVSVVFTPRTPLGRPRSRWVDNIRMELQEVGCGYMDWIGLA